MKDSISIFPPPYKMRKNSNGKGAIAITPSLLRDIFMAYCKRKVVERHFGSIAQDYNQKTSPTGLTKPDLNIKNDWQRPRKVINVQPRRSTRNRKVLCDDIEPSIPEAIVQQEPIPEEPIKLTETYQTIQPVFIEEIPVTYGTECECDEICDLESPFKLKLNIEGYLESLPKENLEKIEDNVTKIKDMVPFLQQIVVSTINVAAKLLDKNHFMDTGRKRNTSDFPTAETFAKRMLGLTSALNRLEAHLITSIECLQQSILTQKFLPEAQNQPNFTESFLQMDPQCASDNYQEFLSTVDSQINFTKKLHKLLQDNANINTQM